MEMSFGSRLKHAWNAFTGNIQMNYRDLGMSYSYRADRPRMSRGNERSIVTSVYNRIALDVAALNVQHVRLDENGRFLSVIDDGLNNCLTLEANVDQTARSFIQDVVISMFDEGSVAIVPVDATTNPNVSGSYDIQSLRVGQILDWYPQYIRTRVYNEQTGRKEDIVVPKSAVAIIENPLYAVINEPNSTMQRLIRKLNLLDVIDEQSGSGKLDLIIQLPYVIKTEARRQQAENRRKDIESQLSGSKYGIAYTDGTEHITQLNRSVNNNLMSQIEYLTSMLYSQLGITQSILDGTADEKTMLNYNNRTIEPIISAIVDEMKRKFLTKTARSQRQSISFFRDPFKLVPVNEIAEIADKFTRNEIMTSNEIRQVVGMKPSDDPRADELRNKNLSELSGSDQQSEEAPITTDNSVEESASDLDDKISKQKSKK
nr:MAG TPA: portal protein [Caudoviricetes sp.]